MDRSWNTWTRVEQKIEPNLREKGRAYCFSLFKAYLTMLIAAHYIQRQMGLVAVFSLRSHSVAQRAVCLELLVHKVAVG